jgi:hypothetical protein
LTHEATPKTTNPPKDQSLPRLEMPSKPPATRRKKNLRENLQKTQKNGKIDLLGKLPT